MLGADTIRSLYLLRGLRQWIMGAALQRRRDGIKA